ncbi:hypothetical protein SLEP1_g17596 [Rubroshorea leprosula]|uniref:Uncharacterized protein n=1 Tax=Rubroshorea leprosula TaxID=152421 RepID=A0AAV5J5A8_9ROSI|nr:hypothetical protein SLEP1_g17596 [Rubroshorea leprosula]
MLFVAPHCFLSSSSSSSSSSSLLFPFSLKPKAILLKRANANSASRTRVTRLCRASLITNPDSFEVGRLIGSYGFMNVTSYSGFQSGADLGFSSPGQLRVQDVGEGRVKIRLYEGRIAQGLLKGTPVIFKLKLSGNDG